MKNFFKFLLFAALVPCIIVSLAFTFKSHAREQAASPIVVIEELDKMSGLTREVIKLDTNQNAQCDTCYSNYISAIRENRQMSEKLSDKNLELYEKYNKSILLEKSLDSLNNALESEKKRIVGTLNRIKKKEKTQEK